MTVKQLKGLLKKPDHLTMDEWNDTSVLIPMSAEFDGFFKSPCVEESGQAELAIDEDETQTQISFVLVPCGFFNEHEGVPPELN